MGSGSSSERQVTIDTTTVIDTKHNIGDHNHEKNMSNVEQTHDEVPLQTIESESGGDRVDFPLSSGKLNVKTVANFQGLQKLRQEHEMSETTNDRNSVTQLPQPSSPDLLLTSFSEKHPQVASALQKTYNCYHALSGALKEGNLSSKVALTKVKGLFNVYFVDKTQKSKVAVAEFAVALGIPKLSHEIISDQRNMHKGLTTWDRELEKTQKLVGIEENGQEAMTANSTDLNQDDTDEKCQMEALKMSQDVISQFLAAILNFSDLCDSFSVALDEPGMVQLLVDMTKELQDSIAHNAKYVNPKTQQLSKYTVRGKILSRILGILHNMSKRVPTRGSFSACRALDVLIPLLKEDVVLFRTKSLLILAYLIDEENNHLIITDEGPIKFLIKLLVRALSTENHRHLGFSAAELAEGLTQIAVNDNNKKTIAKCGVLPVLVTMLQTAKDDEESLKASETLWTLAFDDENRKEITNNQAAIGELEKLLSSEKSEVKKAAAGALWECQGKDKHKEAKQTTATIQEASDCKHVMISYQWDVQKSMIHVRNELQSQGYKVWMDIDEMGGSTLESMARAVENASVVLMGVSQKYKESPNCRSEAEYAFQLHKDIIPLMMDYRYKPNGWLGFIVGSKFWIDLRDRCKLDTNLDKLIKELGNRGRISVEETIQAASVDVVDAPPRSSIMSWKTKDVLEWLNAVDLKDCIDSEAVKRLNGRVLLRLQDLRKESPEFFYTSIKTDLKLGNVFDVMAFTDELDKLVG
ncbi:uncharacterized protein [Acropora muricata]|uniref:uncharacterized protein n=1 Tax=Acropora muricata TaxID=159855 RepID=UPI0034E414B0